MKKLIRILSVTLLFSAHLGGFSSQAFAQDVFEGLKSSIEIGEFSEQDVRNVLLIPYKDQWHEYNSEVGRGVLQFAEWRDVKGFIQICKRYDYDISACLNDPEQGRGDFNKTYFDRAITQAIQQYAKIANLSPSEQFAVFAYENLPKSLGDGSGMIYPYIEHFHLSLLVGFQCTKYYPSENSNLVINHFNKYELFHDVFGTFKTSNSEKLLDPNLETSLLKLNAPDGLSEDSIKKAKETACPEHVDSIIKPLTDLEKQIKKNMTRHPSEQRIDGSFIVQFANNLAENGPSTVAKFSNDLQNAYSVVAENEKFEKDRRRDVPSILAMCTENPERCANAKEGSDQFDAAMMRVLSLEEFKLAFHNKVYSIKGNAGEQFILFSLDFESNKISYLTAKGVVGESKFEIIDGLKFCIFDECIENQPTFAVMKKMTEEHKQITPVLGKFFNAVGYYQSSYVDYQGTLHPPIDTYMYCGRPVTRFTQNEEVLDESNKFLTNFLIDCRRYDFEYKNATNENNSYFEGEEVAQYVFETRRASLVESVKILFEVDALAELMCGKTPKKVKKLITEYLELAESTEPLFDESQWEKIKDDAWRKAQTSMQEPSFGNNLNKAMIEVMIEEKGQRAVCKSFEKGDSMKLLNNLLIVFKQKIKQTADQGVIKKRKY